MALFVPATTEISESIKYSARQLGFDLAGIAPVEQFRELEYFPKWIAAGHHGEMGYLESRTETGELKRSSIQKAAPWARSVVVCALNYNTEQPYSTEFNDPTRGWVSRYAWGQRDYHDIILPKLRALEGKIRELTGIRTSAAKAVEGNALLTTRLKSHPSERFSETSSSQAEIRMWSYVDTGPIVERVLAQHAGIGWVGKNTCVINQQIGSWLFLGVILTSLELEAGMPAPDRCGTCTRCLDACPTNAFIAPYKLDASKCISYLTIEKRGAIPEDLRGGMGRHIFGCDICQDVCPWNREAALTAASEFQPRFELVNPSLEKLAAISTEDFRSMFRGSPVKRAKRTGIRRNAIIAMGNSRDSRFIPLLEELVRDEDEIVSEHALWALHELKGST